MGTVKRVVEDRGNYQIVEVGGYVHYSWEFWAAMARLPREQAKRIVAELEHQHRRRKIIERLT